MEIKVSIITATYNAASHLPALVESLLSQTDMDFEWVVADGGSSDQTIPYLHSLSRINLVISEQKDFGIYDALNRAIQLCSGDYYLVLGADDRLYPHAVQEFKLACSKDSPDIVSAIVESDNGFLKPGGGKPYLKGQLAYISQHSVGTMIKKSLHGRFGYYSRRFPIAADHYFIKQVCDSPDTVIQHGAFVAGYYPSTGISGADILGSMTEYFRVQLETEKNAPLQILLFAIRLLRHAPKIVNFARAKRIGKR